MNILLSTVGRRSYIADYFRSAIRSSGGNIIGTTDRHDLDSEFTVGLLACDKSFVVPSVKSPDYIETLLDICKHENVKMMCSLFDMDCHILSDHLEKFQALGVTTFIPDRKVSDICFDKLKTHQFLNEIGVGSPATFCSLEEFNKSPAAYPVIIKPRYGFASLDMHFAKNEAELLAYFNPDVHIIQELLGGKEHSFDILTDLDGNVLSCVVKRKLKMRAGETDQAITIKNDKLLDLALFVGEKLGYAGPLDVDVFVDGDNFHILEFNPRFGGGYPLAHAAGARFPELMMEIASGGKPKEIIGQYIEDMVMVKDMKPVTMPLDEIYAVCQREI